MKELPCELVRDLIPLYIVDQEALESSELVRNHLEHCEACAAYYREAMQEESESISVFENADLLLMQKNRRKQRRRQVLLAAGLVLLVGINILFALTQFHFKKLEEDEVQILSIYRAGKHNFFVRFLLPDNCQLVDAYNVWGMEIVPEEEEGVGSLVLPYKKSAMGSSEWTFHSGYVPIPFDKDYDTIRYQDQIIWTREEQSELPGYLADMQDLEDPVVVEVDNWKQQYVEHIYSHGKRIRWDYEGNVLLQGGCDLEVTFESGSGSIRWDGEGIDPELIEAFTVVSWNDAKLLLAESNTRAFVEGEEIEFDTRDRCLLFVTAWGGEQVDWADHIIVHESTGN